MPDPARIRLIAVDLDGTLLDPSDRVTEGVAAAVARARAAGVAVVPVTGRPERLVWDVAVEAGLGPLGVCSNGAVLIDLQSKEILDRRGFSAGEANHLIDVIREQVPGIALAIDRGDRFVFETAVLDGLDLTPRPGRQCVDDIRAAVADGCLKFVARRADLSSLALAAELSPVLRAASTTRTPANTDPTDAGGVVEGTGPRAAARRGRGEARDNQDVGPAEEAGMDLAAPGDLAEVTASDIAWVDIGPAGLTKATGLAEVSNRLGIAVEEVAAIGDHYNDLPMLRWAGMAGAMGNAIPEAVHLADIVVGSNADDGVAEFIARVLDRR